MVTVYHDNMSCMASWPPLSPRVCLFVFFLSFCGCCFCVCAVWARRGALWFLSSFCFGLVQVCFFSDVSCSFLTRPGPGAFGWLYALVLRLFVRLSVSWLFGSHVACVGGYCRPGYSCICIRNGLLVGIAFAFVAFC